MKLDPYCELHFYANDTVFCTSSANQAMSDQQNAFNTIQTDLKLYDTKKERKGKKGSKYQHLTSKKLVDQQILILLDIQ